MVVYLCKFQSPSLCPHPHPVFIHLFSVSASLFLTWNTFICTILLLPGSSAMPATQETLVWLLGSGRSPGAGIGHPLQYSGLENSMDRGTWQATVQRLWTQLSEFPFHYHLPLILWASLVAQTIKNLPSVQETRFAPWVGKIRWRRKRQPTPVFLPGESHGQRSLVGYSPWARKESDLTEWLTFTVAFF